MSTTATTRSAVQPALWKKVLAAVAVLAGLIGVGAAAAPAAQAQWYPMADVQVGVPVYNEPSPFAFSDGIVDGPGDVQDSSVKCWKDGERAYGNGWSDRWFIVFVDWEGESKKGQNFEFVHASYVYNQPSVRECVQGQDY